ncbi:hypothetical protein [Acinetobacter baumannii]|uniref:hypothetical protein n=1 Tax=Acinetobacter baumannii TaxID=470 RepID=UPI0035D06378
MKNKPWIEENDPLKEYYGLLDDNELISFLSLFSEWNKNRPLAKVVIASSSDLPVQRLS